MKELYDMTPRQFNNLLRGRRYQAEKEKAVWDQKLIMHQELVLSVLSPHIKKVDRDRAYDKLYGSVGKDASKPKKKKTGMTPEEVKAFLANAKPVK